MSIEDTERAASQPAPLLRTLGDPAAAACVDGFCAVPETSADTTNSSTKNSTSTSTPNTGGADT